MQIESALEEWRRLLGGQNVQSERTELLKCAQATFATGTAVLAVLQPGSTEEVRHTLAIANKFSVPVYVSSRGRNCGYGSKVPYRDSVLMDLRRMNSITEYSEDLAFVRIQPGVTQTQLNLFLREKGGKLWMDPVATFEDCSVLANILERGHGLTGAADRIASGVDFEVVLPNGEVIRTGYSAYPGARIAPLDRWAPGPSLDGLFSQSNFGIVTAMTVWLMPKPEKAVMLAFTLESSAEITHVLEQLRELKLNGTIQFGPRLFNEMRLIQTFSRYPWEKMQHKIPLDEDCVRELRKEMNIPLWTGAVGFYGTEKQIAANLDCVRDRLRNFEHSMIVVQSSSVLKPDAPPAERFAHSLYRGMTGNVEPVTQRPRWRKKTEATGDDWSSDRCGIIWFPVSVPFRGEDVNEAVKVIRETVFAFGFEPDMSVAAIRERTLEVNCSIVFDRDDIAQDQAAVPCARETLARLAKIGIYPHRLGIPTMDALERGSASNRNLLAQLKAVMDPNGLLSVGRY